MKKKSNILKLVLSLQERSADLTPKSDFTGGNVSQFHKHESEGIRIEDVDKEDRWGYALIEQVDMPNLYDHLCYGIFNPSKTQKSEY